MIESGFKKPYVCVDTFQGFTADDMSVENARGNKSTWISKMFRNNHVDWFKESLQRRNINDVEIIQADISVLDAAKLPDQIALCLVDVDLYQPVKRALEKIYPKLSRGGIIVVDDCWSDSSPMFIEGIAKAYDGALQAYLEFTAEHGLPEQLVATKLAVIEKL
jgi:predicted O-methyltransferase YrrM